jgi:HAD superfamily hydrolase (TIGR01484 family)
MVITDLDGTLLQTSGAFSHTDLATLEALGGRRILRVIATGRSLYSASKVLSADFPIDYLIFSSGAGILDWQSRRILVAHHLSQNEIATAVECLFTHDLDFMLHNPIPESHYFWYHATGQENPDFHRRYDRYRAFASPLEPKSSKLTRACQIVAIDPRQGYASRYDDVKIHLSNLTVIRSTSPLDGQSTWIEIFPCSVSKALASAWLAERHRVPHDETLALGNDYNDLDLLQWAAKSFVVENAPTDLKQRFPSVSSNNAHGFTEAVKKWLKS